jgi:hypothetical protein
MATDDLSGESRNLAALIAALKRCATQNHDS